MLTVSIELHLIISSLFFIGISPLSVRKKEIIYYEDDTSEAYAINFPSKIFRECYVLENTLRNEDPRDGIGNGLE